MFHSGLLNRSVIVAIAALCAQGVSQAQTERDLDSHDHGAASINVVIDGMTVFVELESPWNNLVGFEHSPSTDSQREAVAGAMQMLSAPEEIFALNDTAGCQVISTEVTSSLDAEGAHEDHEDGHDDHKDEHDHADGHDDHKDEHDHEDGHDDHKDEHDAHKEHDEEHADHGDEVHSEVVAMYTYECANADKIESVDVKLFDLYSGFEVISYQAAGPSGQTGADLSASNSTLDLSGVR